MVRSFKYLTLLLLLLIASSAARAQIGVSLHDTTGTSGDMITVPVYIDSSLTGKSVTSYRIQLAFNSNYLVADTVIAAGTMSQSLGSITFNNQTAGVLTIACAGTAPLTGTGVLVYIRFRMKAAGGITVSFTGGAAANYFNEGSPTMILRNGSLNIHPAPTISVSPTGSLLTVGDKTQFTAYNGIIPYHWSLTNPAAATIDANGLLTATHAGITRVVAVDSAGTIDTTSGVVEVRAFRLSLRDTSYIQGQTFNLPVYTSDLTGLNVTSGSFQVTFNQNLLTPVGFIQTGTLISSYPAGALGNSTNGVVNFSFAGTTPLSGSGVLVYLQFKVSKTNTGSTSLNPSNIVFNQSITGNSSGANFQIIKLATLTIAPNTGTVLAGDTLHFTASGGTSPYTWSVSDSTVASINSAGRLTGLKGGSVTVSAVDAYGGSGSSGAIQVYDSRVTVADTNGIIGDTVDVPVYASPVTAGMHVQSLQGTVTFDTSVVHPVGVTGAGTLTNGWTYVVNAAGTQMTFAGAGTNDLGQSGALFKMRFFIPAYVSSGKVSNLNLTQFLLNEGSPRTLLANGKITATPVALPAAPTGLKDTALSYGAIHLTWTDNAGNETAYAVQRSANKSSWSTVANLPANSTSDSDSGLVDGTKYFHRVFASNLGGNSGYSNIDSAVTPMRPPTNLAASQVLNEAIKLTWHDNSASELGYYVERKLGSSGTYKTLDSTGANAGTFTDTTGTAGNAYYYRVRGFNSLVVSAYSNEVHLTLTGVKSDQPVVPKAYRVSQNYPNPFNPATTIEYDIPKPSHVTLVVYDILGRNVATLVDQEREAGSYRVTFDASKLSSGIYFYRLDAGSFTRVMKMILMK